MDEAIAWLMAGVALYGLWLGYEGDQTGFLYWLASDLAFCVLSVANGQYAQAFLFASYALLATKGLEE